MGSSSAKAALWGVSPRDWAEISEPGQVPFCEAAFDAFGVREGMLLLGGLSAVLGKELGGRISVASSWSRPSDTLVGQ
jgi:hypothetical protein